MKRFLLSRVNYCIINYNFASYCSVPTKASILVFFRKRFAHSTSAGWYNANDPLHETFSVLKILNVR
jgi:hypothetical protein